MAVSANRLELLQIADAVAREKSIDRMVVIEAMQDAMEKAAKGRYGAETEIKVEINPRSGETRMWRLLEIVDEVEEPSRQIDLKRAQLKSPEAKVGDFLTEALPPMEFGRIAAQSAKQVIVQKVREAERDRQYDEYKDRVGEIVNGTVKRVEYGNVIVDLGRGEAIIRRDELIPREMFRYGDRVRAYVYDVRREQRGPQIFLSRTHPQFMAKLFMQEVPEIYDGVITIRSIARDPGSRAKIAVTSNDSSIDPVGACVGMRGSRVQAVVAELQGEKIDIIPWTDSIADLVVSALQPADVAKVVLDEQAERIEVVVPDEQLSLAIGRRGQNVRLASQLIGWDIDILTEQEESERRTKEFTERSVNYPTDLGIKFELGRRQLLAGKLDEAIGSFQQAQRDPRRHLRAMNYLGQSFAAKGWYTEAAETFEKALEEEMGEDRAKEIRYNFGDVVEKIGDGRHSAAEKMAQYEKARDQFSAVAQIDYGYKDVRTRVENLRKKIEQARNDSASQQ